MKRVVPSEIQRFCKDCLEVVGASPPHAASLAAVLAQADQMGYFSHGLNRLAIYVQDVQLKLADGAAVPSIIKETTATAWVDGKNALGPVVGNFCMDVAIKKAKECGIGWIVAKGSNQYGIGSWYSTQALKHNMLGMVFSNASPLVPPTRSEKNAMGTNPLSVAAPAMDGDSFVLDMATSTTAVGVSEISKKKKEKVPLQDMKDNYQPLGSFGSLSAPIRNLKLTHKKLSIEVKKTTQKKIPMAWAQIPDEKPKDTIAKLAWDIKDQMPLGGEEINSGYKGYGLALMVETFCGILAGGDFGPNIREWTDAKRPANLAQCFVVINPTHFAPGFEQRMSEMNRILRNLEPLHPDKPVLVPGDPERKYMEKVNKEGGVLYTEDQLTVAAQLAAKLKVAPLKVL
ncbi:uncharacterized oxidoreductase YjmC-like isoform X1 [Homalodisca vitripennis]|nr:uncharacterized oxidoreductase YjmC-like isoform X1 [Homalodisca vitripennis]XP_046661705.1 uncharacterized oxidoreductase YjmC-like isoform X1 [Homalodisca vitripennis]XP_046661706.1 uncharacterized oxidoreductase YjmC-like isoform X1 [Homalodisca vitripennis]